MGWFNRSKKPRPPKPNTHEDLIVFGDVNDADLKAVKAAIGQSEINYHECGLYWQNQANPRVARFDNDELQQFYQDFCVKLAEITANDEIGFFSLNMRLMEDFVTEYFEQKFGYRPRLFYLVFTPKALSSLPEGDRFAPFTFLQMLRHFSGQNGKFVGAAVVKSGIVQYTKHRDDGMIRQLARSL